MRAHSLQPASWGSVLLPVTSSTPLTSLPPSSPPFRITAVVSQDWPCIHLSTLRIPRAVLLAQLAAAPERASFSSGAAPAHRRRVRWRSCIPTPTLEFSFDYPFPVCVFVPSWHYLTRVPV